MINLNKYVLRCMQSTTFYKTLRNSSARPTTILKNSIENVSSSTEEVKQETLLRHSIQKSKEIKASNGLVAAAFASLQEDTIIYNNNLSKPKLTFIEKKIAKASNVNDLLSVYDDNSLISRQHALKIVSVLAQWSAAGKIELSEFETDSRFIKLCRILSKGTFNKSRLQSSRNSNVRGDDLSMVLGVTGDDEAAKLIASITLPQMIKVMTSLAYKKRRSTPLLRSLAYNICRSTHKLDLKQCADLLYSMTILNFPESLLLERISTDAIEGLEKNTNRSAVIGSILTSFGLLRYKDSRILDALSEWTLKYYNICRPNDIAALFQTLAVLNYHPCNMENISTTLIPLLNISEFSKASVWLDTVWSLVLLNKYTDTHISSVLCSTFIKKLYNDSNSLSSSIKIKLLNINAAAKYLYANYEGPFLEDNSPINSVVLLRTKEKQILVTSMLDTLGSLFSSSTYLQSNINTGMGFLIDGECVIDKKCNPVPVNITNNNLPNHIRVAILAYDYHDTCRGDDSLLGVNIFAQRLLEARDYKLMIVKYTEFNPRDKLVQRVQFLEKYIKNIAANSA